MDVRIPPLIIKIMLESNPLKSRILVRRLAVRARGMTKSIMRRRRLFVDFCFIVSSFVYFCCRSQAKQEGGDPSCRQWKIASRDAAADTELQEISRRTREDSRHRIESTRVKQSCYCALEASPACWLLAPSRGPLKDPMT